MLDILLAEGKFVTRSWMKLLCILLAALCSGAWPVHAQNAPGAEAQLTRADLPLKIGSGDMLDISVFETPELSTKVRVSNDGNVLLPLIGVLHLGGMTVDQAVTEIRAKLTTGKYVNDPQVTVLISEYATQGVSVLGEVKKPGIYPATGTHRLDDYLSMAEGLTQYAGARASITHRNAPDAPEIASISNTLNPKPGGNPVIQSGDTIFVPKAGEIFVVGDVVKPGGFLMDHDEQVTIIQALALAQGASQAAALERSRILRKTSTGREEIRVNLKKILAMKEQDVPLRDNDILFIPLSGVKSSLDKGTTAILQMAVGVTSFRTF
jgi:polysaccharide export outer membrane protein